MPRTEDEVRRCVNDCLKVCSDAGFRLTHQRIEVVKEICKAEDHPSADSVYERVRVNVPTISLDTVYRTLRTLEKLKLTQRIPDLKGESRFDARIDPHPHFYCRKCRCVFDLSWKVSPTYAFEDLDCEVGIIENTHVVSFGLCAKCLDEEN